MGCGGDCGCPECRGLVKEDDPAVLALNWGVRTAELNPAQSDFWKFNAAKAMYDDAVERGVPDNNDLRTYMEDLAQPSGLAEFEIGSGPVEVAGEAAAPAADTVGGIPAGHGFAHELVVDPKEEDPKDDYKAKGRGWWEFWDYWCDVHPGHPACCWYNPNHWSCQDDPDDPQDPEHPWDFWERGWYNPMRNYFTTRTPGGGGIPPSVGGPPGPGGGGSDDGGAGEPPPFVPGVSLPPKPPPREPAPNKGGCCPAAPEYKLVKAGLRKRTLEEKFGTYVHEIYFGFIASGKYYEDRPLGGGVECACECCSVRQYITGVYKEWDYDENKAKATFQAIKGYMGTAGWLKERWQLDQRIDRIWGEPDSVVRTADVLGIEGLYERADQSIQSPLEPDNAFLYWKSQPDGPVVVEDVIWKTRGGDVGVHDLADYKKNKKLRRIIDQGLPNSIHDYPEERYGVVVAKPAPGRGLTRLHRCGYDYSDWPSWRLDGWGRYKMWLRLYTVARAISSERCVANKLKPLLFLTAPWIEFTADVVFKPGETFIVISAPTARSAYLKRKKKPPSMVSLG